MVKGGKQLLVKGLILTLEVEHWHGQSRRDGHLLHANMVPAVRRQPSHSHANEIQFGLKFNVRELKRSGNLYMVVTLRGLTVPGLPAPPPCICLHNLVQ